MVSAIPSMRVLLTVLYTVVPFKFYFFVLFININKLIKIPSCLFKVFYWVYLSFI